MFCPIHPTSKMTLLFTSWVCDICSPPRDVVETIDCEVEYEHVGLAGVWCPNDEELDEFFDGFTD